MADIAHDNLLWAETLVGSLAACGVAHAVISPGSRSTPLALACLRQPALQTWVQVDERSAAFFALGLAKASRLPIIVLATSGSAPANWFPAVIEADMGTVPLILLSADRPPELRDCGANQTIDQQHLFGSHVRAFHELPCTPPDESLLAYVRALAARAVDQCRWPLPGPVHVNVPLREPLVPAAMPPIPAAEKVAAVRYAQISLPQHAVREIAAELSGRQGLIVCGGGEQEAEFAQALSQLAGQLACPILADPLSDLRFGNHEHSHVLTHYDAFLRRTDVLTNLRPDWVLRFGAAPVSKFLNRFMETLAGVPQFLVDAGGRWLDPLHQTTHLIRADATNFCRQLLAEVGQAAPLAWLEAYRAEEQRAEALAGVGMPLEGQVVQAVLRQLPDDSLVFVSNSMAVRDFDSFSGTASKILQVIGNRGASGIDGNVSTALGLAAASQRPVVALLGDLAFYHDMNGLAAAAGQDVILVVLNNGGGGIFGYLDQAHLAEFERGWLTPLKLDFSLAARMYGLDYHQTVDATTFDQALAQALQGGAHLIEMVIEREESLMQHRLYWEAVVR